VTTTLTSFYDQHNITTCGINHLGEYDLLDNNCRGHVCKTLRYLRDILAFPIDRQVADEFLQTVAGTVFGYGVLASGSMYFVAGPVFGPAAFGASAVLSLGVYFGQLYSYRGELKLAGTQTDYRQDVVLRSARRAGVTYQYCA
jgi:hypothetical protein